MQEDSLEKDDSTEEFLNAIQPNQKSIQSQRKNQEKNERPLLEDLDKWPSSQEKTPEKPLKHKEKPKAESGDECSFHLEDEDITKKPKDIKTASTMQLEGKTTSEAFFSSYKKTFQPNKKKSKEKKAPSFKEETQYSKRKSSDGSGNRNGSSLKGNLNGKLEGNLKSEDESEADSFIERIGKGGRNGEKTKGEAEGSSDQEQGDWFYSTKPSKNKEDSVISVEENKSEKSSDSETQPNRKSNGSLRFIRSNASDMNSNSQNSAESIPKKNKRKTRKTQQETEFQVKRRKKYTKRKKNFGPANEKPFSIPQISNGILSEEKPDGKSTSVTATPPTTSTGQSIQTHNTKKKGDLGSKKGELTSSKGELSPNNQNEKKGPKMGPDFDKTNCSSVASNVEASSILQNLPGVDQKNPQINSITKLFEHFQTEHHDQFDALKSNENWELGIGDAGRSTAYGPLVYTAVAWPMCLKHKFNGFGFQHVPKNIKVPCNFMQSVIQNLKQVALESKTITISASEISNAMFSSSRMTMNTISMNAIKELIDWFLLENFNISHVYLQNPDALSTEKSLSEYLERKRTGIKVEVTEKKQDHKNAVIAAAWICSKHIRDFTVNSWEFKERPLIFISREFGSGLPQDKVTISWIESVVHHVFGFPTFLRHSWSHCKDFLEQKVKEGKCCKVTFPIESEVDYGTWTSLSPSIAQVVDKYKKRGFFFESLKIENRPLDIFKKD